MSRDPQPSPASLFTQVEVTAGAHSEESPREVSDSQLLRELLAGQDRQNELLEELVSVLSSAHRQRANELAQWKQANPDLSRECRQAAETLGKVQSEYLSRLTEEVQENSESLVDGEFMMNEFVDRFGPRLAHLHSVLQVLSQLSAPVDANGQS